MSKQGNEGFDYEGFPKLYNHRLPYPIIMKVLDLPLSKIPETLRSGEKTHGHGCWILL